MTTSHAISSTSDATFDADVLINSTPVLVDFTAAWCGPCKLIAPVLAQIADEQRDRLRIVTLDVDANPVTARRYGIMSMPTLILFRGGEILTKIVGAKPRTALLRELEPYLATPSTRA